MLLLLFHKEEVLEVDTQIAVIVHTILMKIKILTLLLDRLIRIAI